MYYTFDIKQVVGSAVHSACQIFCSTRVHAIVAGRDTAQFQSCSLIHNLYMIFVEYPEINKR